MSSRLEQLYDRHAAGLFQYARAILRNEEAAKDVLQDVFVKLARTGLPELENEKAWLYRLAHNGAIDQTRRAATRRDHRDRVAAEGVSPATIQPDADAADLGRRLLAEVSKLPRGMREVATLYLDDFSAREIGETLGISEGAVFTRITRLRETLRKLMDTE